MVVRATINAAIYFLPFSDRLPERVKTLMGSGASKLQAIEISPDEVRPLVTPSQKIRLRMLEKRAPASPKSSFSDRNSSHEPEDEGEDTARDTDSSSLRQARVESYLAEQHDEFTSLINRNLREAMQQQQQKYAEEASWRRLVLELAMARNGEEASSRLNSLVARASDSVYSYVPFIRGERLTRNVLAQCEDSPIKAETAALLDQLDYASKITLLRSLMVDLGMRADADDIVNFTRGSSVSEDTSITDKVEILVLLMVRLWFIGLKYFLPITQLLYTKFKENDIFLVNNKNFSRLLTMLVRMMEAVEERMNAFPADPSRPESQTSTESTQ